nr:hypothetical protein CFP56_11841 [Quercus suber]
MLGRADEVAEEHSFGLLCSRNILLTDDETALRALGKDWDGDKFSSAYDPLIITTCAKKRCRDQAWAPMPANKTSAHLPRVRRPGPKTYHCLEAWRALLMDYVSLARLSPGSTSDNFMGSLPSVPLCTSSLRTEDRDYCHASITRRIQEAKGVLRYFSRYSEVFGNNDVLASNGAAARRRNCSWRLFAQVSCRQFQSNL